MYRGKPRKWVEYCSGQRFNLVVRLERVSVFVDILGGSQKTLTEKPLHQ